MFVMTLDTLSVNLIILKIIIKYNNHVGLHNFN